ncbi:putative serine/threonine protein kinase Kin1 [Aspergillus brunneoviolaceus CBS 621.78]|uniref:Serine/threonine protein kinase Kin1 n=1 Tax=Aspergillus brunneoviolaceus CBS 621.78 TaxID=1450534 RepID=A0ACD1GGH5_9EURO|nr:serine/threonine protein kinase Kin1 [Aspergillus brunneoviolaceus CBS 621.78]RAH48214.1 serine/threonine protein kinase Kin1 [Aspergillus brunneoviolaceus CBS 621.78]
MSTTAPSTASPSVVRSHSTSARSPSYRPPSSELPHRTRSVAVRPATASQPQHQSPPSSSQYHYQSQSRHSHSHSHSKSQSYDRRPPANQAVFDTIARRDFEASRGAPPVTPRRESSRDRSQERPPTSYRPDSSSNKHRRNLSVQGHQRDSVDMATAGPIMPEGVAGQPQAAAAHLHPANPVQSRRRTMITTPTGQWALGKTLGAGSMGKVKVGKNMDTGEQVAVKIVPRQSTEEHRSSREAERADRSKEIRTAREAAIVSLVNHPYICGMRDVVRTNYHWYMLFELVNGGQMLDYIISHGKLKEKQARKFARQIASALDYCHRNSIVHRDLKIENILISKTGDIKIIDFGLSNLFSPRSQLKTFCGSLYFAAPELLQARQYTGPEVDVWSFGIVLYVLVCGKVPFDDQSMPKLHAKIKQGVFEYPPGLTAECRHIISRMLVTDPKQRASLTEIMNHPWMNKGFNGAPENYLPYREPITLPLDPEVIEKMTGFDFGPPDYITAQLTKVIESEDYQHAVKVSAREQPAPSYTEKKRGVFDFYKRRNSASRDTLSAPSAEAVQLGNDPINAYSPLISVYYLVKEKLDRERAEKNPGALGVPHASGDSMLQMPDLPAPEAAHTNQYHVPGEKDSGRRSRPRARTHGDDDLADGIKNLHLGPQTGHSPGPALSQPETPAKKESTAAGILRRFSTRRTKERSRDPERGRLGSPHTPALNVQPPADLASPLSRGFSVKRTRRADPSPTAVPPGSNQPPQNDFLKAPGSAEPASRSNKFLERSASVNSADYRPRRSRRNDPDATGQPPPSSGSDYANVQKEPTAARETKLGRGHTARTMSLGHARRESIQARRARRDATREANVPEETDADITGAGTALESANEGEDLSKPVYLKGLFSVSTTSSKPLPVIRADIIRALKQLGVDHTEIKGGFSCRHAPSIDLDTVMDVGPPSPDRQGQISGHRRRISFGGLLSHDEGREEFRQTPRSQRRARAPPDHSFVTTPEGSDDEAGPRPSRDLGVVGERVMGETTTRVQSDTGENLILRFEILIVKVPLFSLHGIQFKKVAGGMWQYREMAKKILDALRL